MKDNSMIKTVCAVVCCIILCISAAENTRDRKKSSMRTAQTYLDSLNRGKEVSLISDTARIAETNAPKSIPEDTKMTINGYRIQVLALTSMEAARSKKSEIERALKLQAYINFDQPYYKMYVGNFTSRKEGEKALARIKKAGYPDAWIVKSKVLGDQ